MRVIPPLTITDTLLTSSNATEPGPGESAWDAATNYAVDAVVARATTHRLYTCLAAGVDATLPENALTGVTSRWLDSGPTNQWAMFDTGRNTATTLASPLTVVITPGKRLNSLALMGLVADVATVTVTVAGLVVFTRTVNLVLRNTATWSGYFFGEFTSQSSLVMFDLPPYVGGVITVTLSRASSDVSCGALVVGNSIYLGGVQYNAVDGALNFSTIERDTFGNAKLIPRRTVPKTDQTLWAEKTLVNTLRDVRKTLNAVPALWSGLDDLNSDDYFDSLLILGIYKEFSINLAHPTVAIVTLQLEEI